MSRPVLFAAALVLEAVAYAESSPRFAVMASLAVEGKPAPAADLENLLADVLLGRRVRILLYGHYRIAYLIKDDGNIDVFGVFHGSLDISKYEL